MIITCSEAQNSTLTSYKALLYTCLGIKREKMRFVALPVAKSLFIAGSLHPFYSFLSILYFRLCLHPWHSVLRCLPICGTYVCGLPLFCLLRAAD
ncbi:hypothetical protein F5X98DRAFT_346870 [Xylaria grammica]|nr:hypothetical protein F5X98DRAFT_346870 [Xylaria grammica]